MNLCKSGKQKTIKVHRLVAKAFLPNALGKTQVNHKNGIKTQNIVNPDDLYGETTNLEWATNSENQLHAYKLGLKENARKHCGKMGKQCSKSVNQYDLQGNFIKMWDSIMDAERGLHIFNTNISACCRGKLKTAGRLHMGI